MRSLEPGYGVERRPADAVEGDGEDELDLTSYRGELCGCDLGVVRAHGSEHPAYLVNSSRLGVNCNFSGGSEPGEVGEGTEEYSAEAHRHVLGRCQRYSDEGVDEAQ